MNILKMLYCFVLPKIWFDTSDAEKAELAKKQQTNKINALSATIEEKKSVSILLYFQKMLSGERLKPTRLDLKGVGG